MKQLILHISFLLALFPHSSILAQYQVVADTTRGCDSLDVTFSIVSTATIDTVSFVYWDLGDGNYDTTYGLAEQLTHRYKLNNSLPYFVFTYINNFGDEEALPVTLIYLYRTVTANFSVTDTAALSSRSFIFRHADQPMHNIPYNFEWDFGDGTTATGRRTLHTFTSSGDYPVTLTVSDTVGCSNTRTELFQLRVPDAIASQVRGCDTLMVLYRLVNVDTDSITSILWDFGNGQTSDQLEPDTVTYINTSQVSRNFTVQVFINGNNLTIFKDNYITVFRRVKADFRCTETAITNNSVINECRSTDLLRDNNAVFTYEWSFEGLDIRRESNPSVTYLLAADTFRVSLLLTDSTNRCAHFMVQPLITQPEFVVPNVFSPNSDAVNDAFIVSAPIPLRIHIFTRAGLKVFEAEGTEINWYGETTNGQLLSEGVYYYILQPLVTDPTGRYSRTGFIHLFR